MTTDYTKISPPSTPILRSVGDHGLHYELEMLVLVLSVMSVVFIGVGVFIIGLIVVAELTA